MFNVNSKIKMNDQRHNGARSPAQKPKAKKEAGGPSGNKEELADLNSFLENQMD